MFKGPFICSVCICIHLKVHSHSTTAIIPEFLFIEFLRTKYVHEKYNLPALLGELVDKHLAHSGKKI